MNYSKIKNNNFTPLFNNKSKIKSIKIFLMKYEKYYFYTIDENIEKFVLFKHYKIIKRK